MALKSLVVPDYVQNHAVKLDIPDQVQVPDRQ